MQKLLGYFFRAHVGEISCLILSRRMGLKPHCLYGASNWLGLKTGVQLPLPHSLSPSLPRSLWLALLIDKKGRLLD